MMVDVMLVSGHLSLVSLFRTPLVKTLTGLTPVQFKKKKKDNFFIFSASTFPPFWSLEVLFLFFKTWLSLLPFP